MEYEKPTLLDGEVKVAGDGCCNGVPAPEEPV